MRSPRVDETYPHLVDQFHWALRPLIFIAEIVVKMAAEGRRLAIQEQMETVSILAKKEVVRERSKAA